MTEFTLHIFNENEWKPTNTKVNGVVKEVYYLERVRIRKFEDGTQIEDTSNWIWVASNEQIPLVIDFINKQAIHEINERDNGEDDLNFYDDDNPPRPLITFNEYVRDHDHW